VEFGVISQTGFAFHKILSALSVIVLKFDNLSGLAAQTERLESLLEALQEHTGDVRLMKKKSWSSTSSSAGHSIPVDSDSSSLITLVPQTISAGLFLTHYPTHLLVIFAFQS
jgi:putative ATP-binding cassette transporter